MYTVGLESEMWCPNSPEGSSDVSSTSTQDLNDQAEFPPSKLFVGNLPTWITHEAVESLFAAFGELDEVVMLPNSSKSKARCAFVRFAHPQSAAEAIHRVHGTNPFPNGASPIVVRIADPPKSQDVMPRTSVPMAGVPCVDSASLCGSIPPAWTAMSAPQPAKRPNRGYATKTGSCAPHVDGESKLFVGNLPPSITQQTLAALFTPFDGLIEAFVFRRGSVSANARCAFVRFATARAAEQAIKVMDGRMYCGKPLIVRNAQPKESHEDASSEHSEDNRHSQMPSFMPPQPHQHAAMHHIPETMKPNAAYYEYYSTAPEPVPLSAPPHIHQHQPYAL